MWKNFISLRTNLLQCSKYFLEQQRTTFVFKRKNKIRLNKLRDFFPKKIKRREYDYELIEDLNVKKKPDLNLVLLKDIPGLGMMGEKIKAKFYGGYFDLILPKLAVYENSPEAQNIIRKKTDIKYSSIYSKSVEEFFSGRHLPVYLNSNTKWTLQPFHIRVALRKIGIITHDRCIELPEKEISGPNPDLENRDFIVQVVMNNAERFPVRCKICHWSQTKLQNIDLKNSKTDSEKEPLFEEQREEVIQLKKKEEEFKNKKQMPGFSYVTSITRKNKKVK